jgi:hypothetical protein
MLKHHLSLKFRRRDYWGYLLMWSNGKSPVLCTLHNFYQFTIKTIGCYSGHYGGGFLHRVLYPNCHPPTTPVIKLRIWWYQRVDTENHSRLRGCNVGSRNRLACAFRHKSCKQKMRALGLFMCLELDYIGWHCRRIQVRMISGGLESSM